MDTDPVLPTDLARETDRALRALSPLLLSTRRDTQGDPKESEAYAAIKEDVRRARMYSEQAKFLGKYGLDTKDDLIQHALKVRAQMDVLCKERQKLRNKMRWMKDPAEMQPIREQIFAISDKRKPLRKEYGMCRDIYDRSDDIEKTVERVEFPQLIQQAREANKRDSHGDR